jgi:hypothetical protein
MTLTGFRTVAFNVGGVMLIAGLQNLTGVNWTDYVSPTFALMIAFGVNTALRFVTTTPIFSSK